MTGWLERLHEWEMKRREEKGQTGYAYCDQPTWAQAIPVLLFQWICFGLVLLAMHLCN